MLKLFTQGVCGLKNTRDRAGRRKKGGPWAALRLIGYGRDEAGHD